MNNCKDCEYCDKKLKTKVRPDYIYCNRLGFWRSYKYLCALMRQDKYVASSIIIDSFAEIGKILLSKDVGIKRNLDGFKRFVVNGKMVNNTNKLHEKLKEKL